MNIKRFLIGFVITAVSLSILMVCCIVKLGSTSEDSLPFFTAAESGSLAINKKHVFHEGELHGVWVPYFSISDSAMNEEEFKSRFDEIVQTSLSHGINTLFVHVRSHCDAAYRSDIFPYAEIYRSESAYDPLEYMVSCAHENGLELHAWINPYRVADNADELPNDSPCRKWLTTRNVIEYNGGLYLNPASQDARSLIIDGVREIVSRYDVDGIHLDDYFYEFSESEIDEEDYSEYVRSVSPPKTALPLSQWRKANVNVLISGIYSTVKSIDKDVLFGISPQGSIENDLAAGADVYTWCGQNGYIDYIAPQLYYNSENPVCPFESTADKWKHLVTADGVKLYLGLALYKAGSQDYDDGTWLSSSSIISAQADYGRFIGASGYILYSYDFLDCEQTAEEMAHLLLETNSDT